MLKKVLLALLAYYFLDAVTMIHSALADNDKAEHRSEKKDHKVWYFAGLPVYYFLVDIPVHEGSHALAIAINPNYTVGDYKPWPHLLNGGPHFLLGSVDAVCHSENACADKTGMGVISLAPYITDTVLFTTADLLLSTNVVEPTSISGRVLYFAAMVVPWWDFAYNSVWVTDASDAASVAKNFGIPRWSVMAAGMSVSAVGLWRLWHGYKRAFHGQRHPKESNLVIVPMGDSQTVGATASLRF